MPNLPTVRVSRKGADRVHAGHPWIFLSDVLDTGSAQAGDAVRVTDPKGVNLGTAHYSSTSQIALRMLVRKIEEIDKNFLTRRLCAAMDLRNRLVANSNAYRVVHSEGDLLPGLIVDRYADWLVVQLLNQGMDRLTSLIVEI